MPIHNIPQPRGITHHHVSCPSAKPAMHIDGLNPLRQCGAFCLVLR